MNALVHVRIARVRLDRAGFVAQTADNEQLFISATPEQLASIKSGDSLTVEISIPKTTLKTAKIRVSGRMPQFVAQQGIQAIQS